MGAAFCSRLSEFYLLMLTIQSSVLEQIHGAFLRCSNREQGFLLGSKYNLEQIDICCPLSAMQASMYFISLNAEQTNRQIEQWAAQKICFSGMIHSHVRKKEDLSEADILFAKQLYHAYSLPFLWFGIGIIEQQDVRFKFYKLEQTQSQFSVSLTDYTIFSHRRM